MCYNTRVVTTNPPEDTMSDKNSAPDVNDLARNWLEASKAKWRLQVLQHRSRYNPRTGEYKKLPTGCGGS